MAGHAYVSFIKRDNINKQTIVEEVWGFYPEKTSLKAFFKEKGQIKSEELGTHTLHSEYDFVVEVKDQTTYENCKSVKQIWQSKNYSVVAGQTCVSYAKDVALKIPGLSVPSGFQLTNEFPKDFLIKLKNQNLDFDKEGRASLIAIPDNTTDNFVCDKTHKPYTYYKLWGVDYFLNNSTDQFLVADTSRMRIIANVPPLTTLQWVHFDKNQIYYLKTGKAKKEIYGNDVGDKNTIQYETKVYDFPKTLLKRGNSETYPKGSAIIQTSNKLNYSAISSETIHDKSLIAKFSEEIKAISPSLLINYQYKDKYNQDNFKKILSHPIGEVQRIAIPGLNCYIIKLSDFNDILFILINGKLSLLSSNNYNSSGITAYKLNNNYFVCLNGYFIEIFEIRDSGIIKEWQSN